MNSNILQKHLFQWEKIRGGKQTNVRRFCNYVLLKAGGKGCEFNSITGEPNTNQYDCEHDTDPFDNTRCVWQGSMNEVLYESKCRRQSDIDIDNQNSWFKKKKNVFSTQEQEEAYTTLAKEIDTTDVESILYTSSMGLLTDKDALDLLNKKLMNTPYEELIEQFERHPKMLDKYDIKFLNVDRSNWKKFKHFLSTTNKLKFLGGMVGKHMLYYICMVLLQLMFSRINEGTLDALMRKVSDIGDAYPLKQLTYNIQISIMDVVKGALNWYTNLDSNRIRVINAIIATCVTAPITEEIIFRAPLGIYDKLMRALPKPPPAEIDIKKWVRYGIEVFLIIQFAFTHLRYKEDIEDNIDTFFLRRKNLLMPQARRQVFLLWFGYLCTSYQKRGGVYTSMLVHGIWNFLSIIFMIANSLALNVASN